MVNLKGFKAYTLNPEYISEVPIETEDNLISDHTKKRLVKSESFSRVHQPECDFDDHITEDKLNMYEILQRGRSNLIEFINRGIFNQSEKEIGYLYRQVYENHEQCGILFCINDKDYVEGNVLPHEQTFEDRVVRLQNGADCLGIYNSFPLAFCDNNEVVESIIEQTKTNKPLYFVNLKGVDHYLYAFDESITQKIIAVFGTFNQIYIADGHHRFESYSREVAKLRTEINRQLFDDYDHYPILIYPKSNLKAYSYYRVIKNTDFYNFEEILEKSRKYFKIKKMNIPFESQSIEYKNRLKNYVDHNKKGRFLVYFNLEKSWYKFNVLPYKPNNPIEGVDISYLSTNLFINILNIHDLKLSTDIEYIPENKADIDSLEEQCNNDKSICLLVVCPRISLEEVKSVADSKNCMPPKSTFVYPKPLIGLLFKAFEPLE